MRSILAMLFLLACETAATPADAGRDAPRDTPPDAPLPCVAAAGGRRVVTADWLNGTLSIFGLPRLLDPNCSADDAQIGTIDLSAYAPGPLEVEISPTAPIALVAVSPGFYEGVGAGLAGASDPAADGTLLVVDLDAMAVLGEVPLAAIPMGIAFSPDGTRAYVAEYGVNADPGSAIAVIDVAARSLLMEVDGGARPEQVALSSDGSIGAFSVNDGVVVFRTSDMSMSPLVPVGVDPSGVGFPTGTRTLVVTNSMSHSCSIVDATDPMAPVVTSTPEVSGFPYGVTPLSGTGVLVTTSLLEALITLDATGAAEPASISLPYGGYLLTSVVADGVAITPHPARRFLSMTDLATGEHHAVSGWTAAGPTYVAIEPP